MVGQIVGNDWLVESATRAIDVVWGTEAWGIFRRLSVYLDGRKVDRMQSGTTAVLAISPGPYTVERIRAVQEASPAGGEGSSLVGRTVVLAFAARSGGGGGRW